MAEASPRPPSLDELQLERLQLENEKLRLELAERRRPKPWLHLPIQMVPIVTALVAVAGFSWGIVQYGQEQAKNRREQHAQAARQQELAQRELMKPWLESQRDIYAQALAAAATVANASDGKVRAQAAEEFWRLYQGKMILVETRSVSDAMVSFGSCLSGNAVRETCDRSALNERSRRLATAMADSMAATAKMTYEQFAGNQFTYTSTR
jgi:hypothetical protein